ncbi:hypothetical protein BD414DRAFT_280852 [Trametes punicea]|nr:hypothetical protein BD414DRAFT_280852 [Trametes punicea]
MVKGCERAVLVGDHVQLRPTVKPMGKALEFDKSLFERLWKGSDYPELVRTMLEVQYRFSEDVGRFPSQEFYEGRLRTGNSRDAEIAATLGISSFPWPLKDGHICPVVFVPCTSEEDRGRQSKSNAVKRRAPVSSPIGQYLSPHALLEAGSVVTPDHSSSHGCRCQHYRRLPRPRRRHRSLLHGTL